MKSPYECKDKKLPEENVQYFWQCGLWPEASEAGQSHHPGEGGGHPEAGGPGGHGGPDVLKDYFNDLDEFAKSEELKSGDAERAVNFLRKKNPVMRIQVNDIFYAANDGKATSVLGQKVDISGTEFFKNIIQSDVPYVLSLFDLESFSEDEYAIAKNVIGKGGEIVATVFYALRLATIESPISGMDSSDMFFGFAMTEEGNFIVPINHESILNRTSEFLSEEEIYLNSTFLKKISDMKKGSFIFKIKNYPDEFVVWKKIAQTNCIIAVDAPLNRIDSSTAVFKNSIIIIVRNSSLVEGPGMDNNRV